MSPFRLHPPSMDPGRENHKHYWGELCAQEVLSFMDLELGLGASSLVEIGHFGRKYPTAHFCTKQHWTNRLIQCWAGELNIKLNIQKAVRRNMSLLNGSSFFRPDVSLVTDCLVNAKPLCSRATCLLSLWFVDLLHEWKLHALSSLHYAFQREVVWNTLIIYNT